MLLINVLCTGQTVMGQFQYERRFFDNTDNTVNLSLQVRLTYVYMLTALACSMSKLQANRGVSIKGSFSC